VQPRHLRDWSRRQLSRKVKLFLWVEACGSTSYWLATLCELRTVGLWRRPNSHCINFTFRIPCNLKSIWSAPTPQYGKWTPPDNICESVTPEAIGIGTAAKGRINQRHGRGQKRWVAIRPWCTESLIPWIRPVTRLFCTNHPSSQSQPICPEKWRFISGVSHTIIALGRHTAGIRWRPGRFISGQWNSRIPDLILAAVLYAARNRSIVLKFTNPRTMLTMCSMVLCDWKVNQPATAGTTP